MKKETSNQKMLESIKLTLWIIGGTIVILISFITLIVDLIKSIR